MKTLALLILLCLVLAGCATKPSHVTFIKVSSEGPPPPCDPCDTNGYTPPEPYTSPVYTNGELYCIVVSSNIVAVTNTSPFKEYVLQLSTDLLLWTICTSSQIGSGENFYGVTNASDAVFYRAQDVTGGDVIVYPTYSGGSGGYEDCPGTFVGSYVYRPVTNSFPFQPIGSSHSIVDPSGNPDTRFQLVGRFGDTRCSATPLTLPSSLPDPYYSLTDYFHNTMPGTNYPVILRGFQVRTDL